MEGMVIMERKNGTAPACCIKGCEEPGIHNGLCVTHHRRNQTYGSPIATKVAAWRWLRLTAEERFWMQVRKTEGDGCWLWTAGKDKNGYGAFKAEIDGVTHLRAHRYSFHLNKKRIPFSLSVCHTCDTPACVRPDHLFLGTNQENHLDKIAKGRARGPGHGEQHFMARLTEDQVRSILDDARPHSQIAHDCDVSPGTISDIKRRISWTYLGTERGVKAKRISPRRGKSDKGVTPEIVRAIRASEERGIDLAARYGLKPQDISDIRHRRSWAHID